MTLTKLTKVPIIADPDKAIQLVILLKLLTIGELDIYLICYNWLVQSPMTDDSGALLATATYTHSMDFTALLATTCRTVSHSCIIVKHLCSCKLTQSFINHTSSLLTNSPLPLAQAHAISPQAGVVTTAQCHNSPTLDYMVSQLPPFLSISILASIP